MRTLLFSILTAFALSFATSHATAQSASFTRIGSGCGASPPPLLNARTLPKLGTQFTLTYTGPNGTTPVSIDQPILMTGTSPVSVTIPPFSSIQPSNCVLQTAPFLMSVMPPVGTRFQDTVSFMIPNDMSLLGATLYQQFLDVYFNCRSTPCVMQMLRVTNGAKLVIGT